MTVTPLADVRMLAIVQDGAGAWATMQLADLGGDVTGVEGRGGTGAGAGDGDASR